jgi:hypothetical protein
MKHETWKHGNMKHEAYETWRAMKHNGSMKHGNMKHET